MSNDSRYTKQRELWQEDMDNSPTNRPYPVMFEALPVGSLSMGMAGEMLLAGDPVRFDERGLFIPTTEAKAVAIAKTAAGYMRSVTVQKVR